MNKKAVRLSMIGAGQLGKSLARLWTDHKLVQLQQVCTRTQTSAEEAIRFIGAGEACPAVEELQATELVLIASPDSQIFPLAQQLSQQWKTAETTIVFHCSGALTSEELSPLSEIGARIASVHPIKSFAQPDIAISSFDPTYCGYEGNEKALEIILPLFEGIGGRCMAIHPKHKLLYHAAAVFANNYLVSLLEVAQQLYETAGLDRKASTQLLMPILQGTLVNIEALGTKQALTGPIARNDTKTVEKHLAELQAFDPDVALLYQQLGLVALGLKQDQTASNQLEQLLKTSLPSLPS